MVRPEVRSRQGIQTVPWVNLSSWLLGTKTSGGRKMRVFSLHQQVSSSHLVLKWCVVTLWCSFHLYPECLGSDLLALICDVSHTYFTGWWGRKTRVLVRTRELDLGGWYRKWHIQHMSATLDNLEFHTLDSLFLDCPTSFLLSFFFQNALTLQLWYV